MQLIIQPRDFEDDHAKQYQVSKMSFGLHRDDLVSNNSCLSQVVEASVVPISTVQAQFPELEVHIDPTDFTRLRFVVVLQNYKEEVRRLRLVQWNDLSIDRWQKMSKTASTDLQLGWADALRYLVDTKDPKDVQELLGKK